MNIKDYKNIYMCGIGGTSMSGIALILKNWNYNVTGSDGIESNYTINLKEKGINVIIGQRKENVTNNIDLFIYTAAIKEDNPEYIKAKELNIPMIERGTFLGELTRLFSNTIGISGTHGKTTTTSMVSLAFIEANLDPTIQIGANLKELNSNYRIGKSNNFIIEACEYSNSFLNFTQKSAIILNIDDDHLDFFGSIENTQRSFIEYVKKLPVDGYLVINNDDSRVKEVSTYTKAKVITVGKDNNSEWYYLNIRYNEEGHPKYDVYHNNQYIDTIELNINGDHNVINSLCALALCNAYNIDTQTFQKAIKKFTGAERRLEYIGTFNEAKIYDDYGHHPTEINAVFNSIKNIKHNKSWAIFEAHTYTRLKQHLKEFAQSLINFDHIIIIDIYAAREKNIYNITEDDLIKEINKLNKEAIHISDYNDIKEYLKQRVNKDDIIITLGAGYVTKIAKLLKEN